MDEAQIRIAFLEWMRASLAPASALDTPPPEEEAEKRLRLIDRALTYTHFH